MAKITLGGNPITTVGELPKVGDTAPALSLKKNDLSVVTLEDFAGKKKIISVFPSIDTEVCATSVKKFNEKAAKLNNVVILNVAADLPFALKRFCGAEGIDNVVTLSTFGSTFPKDWGVEIADGAFAGLCSRAIIVLDENNKVIHSEHVSEIANEPSYEAAVNALH